MTPSRVTTASRAPAHRRARRARLDTAAVLGTYKSLSQVECAFRSLKTFDLHVRSIHHYTEACVRVHVFHCMLAFYVQWHRPRVWAPMLFGDELPPGCTGRSLVSSATAAVPSVPTTRPPSI